MNISGGLYQPDAKAVIVKTESLGEIIPADKLEQVVLAILNFSRVEDMRVVRLTEKYSWGEVDAVSFVGEARGGRKLQGYFDAKGQGTIKIAS